MFFLIALGLRAIVLVLGGRFSKKSFPDQEKLRPFECGFMPKFSARLPFSMRFFLLSLIFLVFDVELVLLFPFSANLIKSNIFMMTGLIMVFLLILVSGTFHEWNQGILDWSIYYNNLNKILSFRLKHKYTLF